MFCCSGHTPRVVVLFAGSAFAPLRPHAVLWFCGRSGGARGDPSVCFAQVGDRSVCIARCDYLQFAAIGFAQWSRRCIFAAPAVFKVTRLQGCTWRSSCVCWWRGGQRCSCSQGAFRIATRQSVSNYMCRLGGFDLSPRQLAWARAGVFIKRVARLQNRFLRLLNYLCFVNRFAFCKLGCCFTNSFWR